MAPSKAFCGRRRKNGETIDELLSNGDRAAYRERAYTQIDCHMLWRKRFGFLRDETMLKAVTTHTFSSEDELPNIVSIPPPPLARQFHASRLPLRGAG